MYYNTLVTYRDPSTGGLNSVIGLYHAKNDAEAFKKFVPAKSHQEKLRVLVDFLRVASHLAEDLEGEANVLIKTLTKAIVDSVSATGGSNAQAGS